MKIEIVTHCYRYASLLRYQLSSLILHPPPEGVKIIATVCYMPEDEETRRVLDYFSSLPADRVQWNWMPLTEPELCQRSIGRNRAALATRADWVWFADADYWFDTRCWEWFLTQSPTQPVLIYPKIVQGHRKHELGDACIQQSRESNGLVKACIDEFGPNSMNRAIGGIQITRGDWCRKNGYLKNNPKAQAPREPVIWKRTREDVWFRLETGSKGIAMPIPGVYRIRHSQAGRHVTGLTL
jgi:hypothetical protein